jgi:hypothetical protein
MARCLTRRGEVPEWPKGADCKSAGDAFEGSNPSLSTIFVCGNSSVGRARAFQARGRGFESRFPLQFAQCWMAHGRRARSCTILGDWARYATGCAQVAQSVEHVLGKDEVGGSIPLLGFCPDQGLPCVQDFRNSEPH